MSTLLEMAQFAYKVGELSAKDVLTWAAHLGKTSSQVYAIYRKFGKGYIYTPSGRAYVDSPQARHNLTIHFERVVVVDVHGNIIFRDTKSVGSLNRAKNTRKDKRERDMFSREMEAHKALKMTRSLFEEGVTNPSPKRGGKANSHEDIGKYVHAHIRVSMEERSYRYGRQTIRI